MKKAKLPRSGKLYERKPELTTCWYTIKDYRIRTNELEKFVSDNLNEYYDDYINSVIAAENAKDLEPSSAQFHDMVTQIGRNTKKLKCLEDVIEMAMEDPIQARKCLKGWRSPSEKERRKEAKRKKREAKYLKEIIIEDDLYNI